MTIRFNAPYLDLNPNIFFKGHVPHLTDVDLACAEPPATDFYLDDQLNTSVTLHIPVGSLDKYKNSVWKDWNLVEDQEAVTTDYNSGEWGYNTHYASNTVNGDLFTGFNEFAIRMPADTAKKYIGKQISTIKFYSSSRVWESSSDYDYEYVFIADKDGNYLAKQEVVADPYWNVVKLEKPLTITGRDLYIGWGSTSSALLTVFNDDANAPRGLFRSTSASGKFSSMYFTYYKPLPLRIKTLPKGIYIVNGKKIIRQ